MFITIMAGNVAVENDETLKGRFSRELRHPPEGLLQSFLVQAQEDPLRWRVISVWRNREAYEHEHSGRLIDAIVEMFCDAGTTPDKMTFRVVENYTRV